MQVLYHCTDMGLQEGCHVREERDVAERRVNDYIVIISGRYVVDCG